MGSLKTESRIKEEYGHEFAPFLETRTADVAGRRIRYADAGKGETVLLIHGFPETLQGWREVVPKLSTHFRVLAPDVLGAGGSDKPDIKYSPQELADFVRDFLDAMSAKKAHIVGTDTGLAVALAFAGTYPQYVGKTVLCAGTPYLEDMRSWEIRTMCIPVIGEITTYSPCLRLVLKNSLRKGFVRRHLVSKEMYEECARSMWAPGGRRAAIRMMRSLARERAFLDECVGKITSPVMVIFADKDCYFPLQAGERLANDMGARLEVIPDCGHFLQEEKPEEFSDLVREFLLSDLPPTTGSASK